MPTSIGIMAVTAAATKSLRHKVEGLLEMRSPLSIVHSPDKSNLRLSVKEIKEFNSLAVPNIFNCVLSELKRKSISFPRAMIFCKIKTDCAKLYTFFKAALQEQFCYPPGANPDIVECRLVDMYFKGTSSEVKEMITNNFTKDSNLRVVICTDALEWASIVRMLD